MPFWEDRLIYLVRSGSHAYGTNIATSDEDTRGVCIPPAEYLIGLQNFEQHVSTKPDTTIFGLHKFARLALDCNPNIIELLHVRIDEVLHITPAGRRLRDNAHLFVTKRAFKTFGGYAMAQLKLLNHGKTARHGSHSDLVEKYGFDTKNATHLIRLLKMGVEILHLGVVNTYRKDRDELLAIRHGEWSLERVLSEAAVLDEMLKWAHEKSTLPEHPPFEQVNQLVMDLTRDALEGRL